MGSPVSEFEVYLLLARVGRKDRELGTGDPKLRLRLGGLAEEIGLFGDGGAVGAWVGGAEVDSRFAVVEDGLAAAHGGCVVGVDLQDVAHLAQRVESGWTYARFDDDAAAELLAGGEGRLFPPRRGGHGVNDGGWNELRVRGGRVGWGP